MNKIKEKIKNYPIKRKLLTTMGAVTILGVLVAVIIMIGMQYITTNVKGIFNGPMTNMSDVANVKYGLTDLQKIESCEHGTAGYKYNIDCLSLCRISMVNKNTHRDFKGADRADGKCSAAYVSGRYVGGRAYYL